MSLPPARRVPGASSQLGAEAAPREVRAAVALAYAENDPAPKVVAKGRGLVARAIIERARAAGVYVHDSPELVGLLMQVDLDRHIPAQLYVAVAEVLAWIYRLEQGAAAARSQPIEPDDRHER